MSITKTLGGDRLGSGKKMKVHLHGYERSTHDLGYLWRSTMSAGTLVPFMKILGLPGDTFDINLDCNIKTHPTIGPLFGSHKVQLDILTAPVRLYQGMLHNNKLGIGMNMSQATLPYLRLRALKAAVAAYEANPELYSVDNIQVNPSHILSYLGIRGVGYNPSASVANAPFRDFNGLPLLAYWDIYKNYYANKQEEIGAMIHSSPNIATNLINAFEIYTTITNTIPQAPAGSVFTPTGALQMGVPYGGGIPNPDTVIVNTSIGPLTLTQLSVTNWIPNTGGTALVGSFNYSLYGPIQIYNWQYANVANTAPTAPQVVTFDLNNIDDMREHILANTAGVDVTAVGYAPYSYLGEYDSVTFKWTNLTQNQEGLGLKTYQSDLFNNWLSTEWIDGPGGINEITAIDTSGGSFNIDTLNLSKKVYEMLNRVAVSGGTYDDWLDVIYDHERHMRAETPVYQGGLSKELVFQEVVSNAQATGNEGGQPLGTLAGKGVMSNKHKGGKIIVRIDEPCYIMGIVSITPRVDYSQGNDWDMTELETVDDFHKPHLDEIGFQELITEQLAWWTTYYDPGSTSWITQSAGKQPAWINYMTAVNKTFGNFAVGNGGPVGEMFMTLNRRYEVDESGLTWGIADLTSYIDPTKFNHIFAQTSLDAQNYWVQIACDITARRKMSAKLMPNI